MLRQIVSVQNFRAFKGWRDSANAPFRDINVIYGTNGSGKSTLATLLQKVAAGTASDAECVVKVDKSPGPGERSVREANDPFWERIRVFNTEYVRKSLRFDGTDGSDASPILVLGEKRVDAEAQTEALSKELEQLDASRADRDRELQKARTDLENQLTEVGRRVVDDLSVLGGPYKATNVYNARQVRALLEGDQAWADEQSHDVSADLKIVNGTAPEPITYRPPSMQKLEPLVKRVQQTAEQTVTGSAINQLKDNALLASWVQEGLRLHEHTANCAFCGSVISDERRQQLEAHFDDSLERLQGDLGRLKRDIADFKAQVADGLSRVPPGDSLPSELQDSYQTAKKTTQEELEALLVAAGDLDAAVEEKLTKLFSAQELHFSPTNGPDFRRVTSVIDEYNTQVRGFEDQRAQAARRVEYHIVGELKDRYPSLVQRVDTASAAIETASARRRDITAEMTGLKQADVDPLPLADELSRDVARLLGRHELTFRSEGDRYLIERDGEPATALSEGERTAISLLHFLCSLRDYESTGKQLVVIIDDPVSSLDGNVLVGASSHIWSSLVKEGSPTQVFLLTHNFELFRIWTNHLTMRQKIKSRIYEIRMRFRETESHGVRRQPVISEWPTDKNFRKRIRSQYHYLFWKIGSTIEECAGEPDLIREAEAIAIIPNAARKMLEGFLSFKYPDQVGNFEGSVVAAMGTSNDAMRQRVTRFVHHHSHNEEGDTSLPVEPGEAVAVLSAVFELIDYVDHEHFEAMCNSLELNPEVLLRGAAE